MPQRNLTLTLNLDAEQSAFLEARGATSHRGRSPWSRSRVLRRKMALLVSLFETYDPRRTGSLSREEFDLAVSTLRDLEPWSLSPRTIALLEHLIAAPLRELDASAAPAASSLLQKLPTLTFAEKAALADAAEVACIRSGHREQAALGERDR